MNALQMRTWAEISLERIAHNYNTIRSRLPEGCRFLGVVKADAYGHGAARVAALLQELGAEYLAVSCLAEAVELRMSGIKLPILLLSYTPPEFGKTLLDYNLTQSVNDEEAAWALSACAEAQGKKMKVHLKLDSGMGRMGFTCGDEASEEACLRVLKMPGLDMEGVFTHFSSADEVGGEEYSRA